MLYTVVNAGVMFIRSSVTAGILKTPESYEPWKVHLSKLFGIHNVKSGFYRKHYFAKMLKVGFILYHPHPCQPKILWSWTPSYCGPHFLSKSTIKSSIILISFLSQLFQPSLYLSLFESRSGFYNFYLSKKTKKHNFGQIV